LRKLAIVAALAVALVTALAAGGGASAGPGANVPIRIGGHGHWFMRACDRAPGGAAACDVDVVTDSAGAPLVTSASPPPGAYGPAQLRGGYALTGTGSSSQTIGIVDAYDSPTIASDLSTFSTQYGLPACTTANGCFRKVNQSGGTSYPRANSGWALEIALDVETAHGICPACKILLVEASSASMSNLGAAENEAIALGATVVSNSWGGGEYSSETTDDNRYFNHPGVAITVSSGDGGYGVEYPAASRYVTAVGGTTLNLNGTSWASETTWSGAGSGCSSYEPKPAWQTDTGCSRRTVADVSADADPNTGAAVYDGTAYSGQSGWFQVGGTSLAAPLVAAVYALTGTASSVNAGSTPYAHAGSLHDVTSGSNGSCGGSYLCTAKPGYDGPTGLGTPNGLTAFTAGSTQPDFSVGVSPSSATVQAGTDATYTVSVGSSGGFGGTVSLSASGLPAGATSSFSPGSVAGSGSSTLTVHTGSVAPGSYPFTITGTSGSTSHSTAATLVVQSVPAGDFAIAVSPSSARISRTSTSTYQVTITPQNGFAGSVSLSASGFVSGLSGSFSPNPATTGSTFTVTASGVSRRTNVTLTITGTSGTLSHSTTLRLRVR
jgi:subtilase family serine protease